MRIKNNWKIDDVIMPDDMNRIEDNIYEGNQNLEDLNDSLEKIIKSLSNVDNTKDSDKEVNTARGLISLNTRDENFGSHVYKGASIHLKSNGKDGLTDGGQYHVVLHMTGWDDASGGKAHQLAFTDNNNIWWRSGSGTTWSAWTKLNHTTVATTSANGLMAAADKVKLNGIANNANNFTYSHPSTHPASMITTGTFPTTAIYAAGGTDYGTARVRNAYFTTSKPSSLANGVICFVYE